MAQDPPPEDDPEEDREEAGPSDVTTEEAVPHLEWFDGLAYEALREWVPTSGTVPKGSVHAVARLKGAVLQASVEGDHLSGSHAVC